MNKAQLKALEAYLALLAKNSAAASDYALKDHFAQQLVAHLGSEPPTPAVYRKAVGAALGEIPEEYKKQAVQVAREFFPFLMSDLKGVAQIMQSGGYRGFEEVSAVATQTRIRSVPDLIAVAVKHEHAAAFAAARGTYLKALRERGLDAASIALRGRLATALMYLCRDREFTPEAYRTAIDRVMSALPDEPPRQFFVQVAREFYHFLRETPGAEQGIKADVRFADQEVFA
ncbi:MAG TPA: hypothetical protein VFV17_08630 [Usitatibacteraceae bacterium]|nr:hypothetical protein [Usitatibacteraceae bacterium]